MGNRDQIFPWPRYWFPAESGEFDAFRQGGYLALPEEKYKPYYPSVPATLSELAQIPVLILLGDPGSGKSQALDDEYRRLQSEASNDQIVRCNLKGFGAGDQQALAAELLDQKRLPKRRVERDCGY